MLNMQPKTLSHAAINAMRFVPSFRVEDGLIKSKVGIGQPTPIRPASAGVERLGVVNAIVRQLYPLGYDEEISFLMEASAIEIGGPSLLKRLSDLERGRSPDVIEQMAKTLANDVKGVWFNFDLTETHRAMSDSIDQMEKALGFLELPATGVFPLGTEPPTITPMIAPVVEVSIGAAPAEVSASKPIPMGLKVKSDLFTHQEGSQEYKLRFQQAQKFFADPKNHERAFDWVISQVNMPPFYVAKNLTPATLAKVYGTMPKTTEPELAVYGWLHQAAVELLNDNTRMADEERLKLLRFATEASWEHAASLLGKQVDLAAAAQSLSKGK